MEKSSKVSLRCSYFYFTSFNVYFLISHYLSSSSVNFSIFCNFFAPLFAYPFYCTFIRFIFIYFLFLRVELISPINYATTANFSQLPSSYLFLSSENSSLLSFRNSTSSLNKLTLNSTSYCYCCTCDEFSRLFLYSCALLSNIPFSSSGHI